MIKIPIEEIQRIVATRVVQEHDVLIHATSELMDAVHCRLDEVNAWVLDSGGEIVAPRYWGGKGGKTDGYYLMPDEVAVLFKLRYG